MTPRWQIAVAAVVVAVFGWLFVRDIVRQGQTARLAQMESQIASLELRANLLAAEARATRLEMEWRWAARWYEAQFPPSMSWPGQTGVGGPD